jgi:hypothetical protein
MTVFIVLFILISLAIVVIFFPKEERNRRGYWESYSDADTIPSIEEFLNVLHENPFWMDSRGYGYWQRVAFDRRTPSIVLAWMVVRLIERHKIERNIRWNSPHAPSPCHRSDRIADVIQFHPNLPTDSLKQLMKEFRQLAIERHQKEYEKLLKQTL